MNHTINRKEFLKPSTSIIAGLGIPCVFEGFAHHAEAKSDEGVAMDDSYLVKGLTGMVRADGWFEAHWGAAVLAGYYLCRDNSLSEQTIIGIKRQLDTVIRLEALRFRKSIPRPMRWRTARLWRPS